MPQEPPSSLTPLAKAALYLSFATLVIFYAGVLAGVLSPHQPGAAMGDMIAFILCRILSPVLAFSAWVVGFVAVLRHPGGPTWSAVAVMVLILIFILLLGYSAFLGTAAFHPAH
jgi:hypothetical protein